jgi:SAM-dependent MidA family methyltransferase
MSASAFAGGLAAEIARDGPMRFDRFMARCVSRYYATRDPFGEGGDFITAPEISQMFGELIGVWCASAWEVMGKPKRLSLVELGPGRGTLMADLLRAARVMPPFIESATVHLVETSPALRERQNALLSEHAVTWHDAIDTVPDGPMILIANEFFDALPVRQLVRAGEGFRERCVGLDPAGMLAFVVTEEPVSPALAPGFARDVPDGGVIEVSPDRDAVARAIGRRLARWSSSALIIDYGHLVSAPGETVQAVRGHQFADVLAAPGEADLTAHVDFAALGAALRASGAAVLEPMTQGEFLMAMGLREREAALKQRADARTRLEIALAARRLAGGEEMGHLFKVLAATHPEVPPPYPFNGPTR